MGSEMCIRDSPKVLRLRLQSLMNTLCAMLPTLVIQVIVVSGPTYGIHFTALWVTATDLGTDIHRSGTTGMVLVMAEDSGVTTGILQ